MWTLHIDLKAEGEKGKQNVKMIASKEKKRITKSFAVI